MCTFRTILFFLCLSAISGCVSVKVEPIKVQVDVTIRIERELKDIFGELDETAVDLAHAGSDEASG